MGDDKKPRLAKVMRYFFIQKLKEIWGFLKYVFKILGIAIGASLVLCGLFSFMVWLGKLITEQELSTLMYFIGGFSTTIVIGTGALFVLFLLYLLLAKVWDWLRLNWETAKRKAKDDENRKRGV